jgi:hypothetical protein
LSVGISDIRTNEESNPMLGTLDQRAIEVMPSKQK